MRLRADGKFYHHGTIFCRRRHGRASQIADGGPGDAIVVGVKLAMITN